ncbi:MAG: hypothetical protein ACXVAX_13065 [Pseudobdellovibrio sp.]
MRIIEQMFYEARPFLYGVIGLYSIAHYDNKTLVVCGLTLLFCSTIVFNMRLNYRDQMARIKASSHFYQGD